MLELRMPGSAQWCCAFSDEKLQLQIEFRIRVNFTHIYGAKVVIFLLKDLNFRRRQKSFEERSQLRGFKMNCSELFSMIAHLSLLKCFGREINSENVTIQTATDTSLTKLIALRLFGLNAGKPKSIYLNKLIMNVKDSCFSC